MSSDDLAVVLYGDDGPAFTRTCPKCRRFLKFPAEIKWRERFNGSCEFPKIACSKCGPVAPDHIGWASDYR